MDEQNFQGYFDEDQCFNILDFQNGDNLICIKKGKRVKGIVTSVNITKGIIMFKNKDFKDCSCFLNEVSFLQPPEKGWLHK